MVLSKMGILSLGNSLSSKYAVKTPQLRYQHECPRFHEHIASLDVSADALYAALLADAETQSPNWDLQGRQANIWKTLGFIPSDVWEPSGTNTKQVSRTLEVRLF